ncbi:hypothetical protein F2981_33785 (plasmid) [Sinorhizobium meliloti]|nr:hypothetical protein [Sinorhizobium meliloti]
MGSTACTGLAAKPMLDMDVTLSGWPTFPTQARTSSTLDSNPWQSLR